MHAVRDVASRTGIGRLMFYLLMSYFGATRVERVRMTFGMTLGYALAVLAISCSPA